MTNLPPTRRTRPRRVRRRRAIVALVVLLLIAVALASSYSAMRSQTITLSVRENATLGVSARQAALAGVSVGLREMHSPDWTGTGTTLSRMLSSHVSFQVQFVAGDDTLTSDDDDYDDLPYRVTLVATGTASDPANASRLSQYTVRAVARLIPRALPDEPSDWETMQDYTFFQTEQNNTIFDLPARIEGAVRLQGALKLGHHYPDDGDAWANYFYHLNLMRLDDDYDYGDYRPFTGPIDYDSSQQSTYIRQILTTYLSVSTSDQAVDTAASDWSKPSEMESYRLFPGGPEYAIPEVSGTITNQTLGDSPAENPLGLYYADSDLTLADSVTVRGTLFCREELEITGTDVVFEPVALPDLVVDDDEPLTLRMPAATCKEFTVCSGASCTVNGLLAVFGDLNVNAASSRGVLTVSGRVIAEDLDICEDTNWDNVDWETEYDNYLYYAGPSLVYFPVWVRYVRELFYSPTVQIKAGDDARYHWYREGETVFVPHEDDFSESDASETPGLRWELIEISM